MSRFHVIIPPQAGDYCQSKLHLHAHALSSSGRQLWKAGYRGAILELLLHIVFLSSSSSRSASFPHHHRSSCKSSFLREACYFTTTFDILDVKCGGRECPQGHQSAPPEHLLHIIRENIFSPQINIFARNISHHAELVHHTFSSLSQPN